MQRLRGALALSVPSARKRLGIFRITHFSNPYRVGKYSFSVDHVFSSVATDGKQWIKRSGSGRREIRRWNDCDQARQTQDDHQASSGVLKHVMHDV